MRKEKAPKHNLPTWKECMLLEANSRFEYTGPISIEPEPELTPLHEFILEYDDNDEYKSDWFMHRLEKLVNYVKVQTIYEAIDNCTLHYGGKLIEVDELLEYAEKEIKGK